MKTLLLTLFACLLTAGTALNAANNDPAQPKVGDIKITLYGAGGIVSSGETQKVCPQTSTAVCANVVVQGIVAPDPGGDLDLTGVEALLDHRGARNRIRFTSGSASRSTLTEGYETNGKDASFVILQ